MCYINKTTKPGRQGICLQHGLLNRSPLLRPTSQNKKDYFQNILIDNAPHHPKPLMEMRNAVIIVFMPANTISFLQPMEQGVIPTFNHSIPVIEEMHFVKLWLP